MHAGKSPEQRELTLKKFRTGETWMLICTDLLARGIDFKGVNMVINYDLPQTAVAYIHRIGRTGRAGRSGKAISFFCESDINFLRPIANVMKLSGCEVPSWMLSLKKISSSERRRLEHGAIRRKRITTTTTWDRNKVWRKKMAIESSKSKK